MSNLKVEIISPTGIIFQGECQIASIPTIDGDLGVMYNHEAFIAKLKEGEILLFNNSSQIAASNKFSIEGGFAKIESQGTLLILID